MALASRIAASSRVSRKALLVTALIGLGVTLAAAFLGWCLTSPPT